MRLAAALLLGCAAVGTALAHRARTGHIQVARTPQADGVRIPTGLFRMGTNEEELERAVAACAAEVGPRFADFVCDKTFLGDERADRHEVLVYAFLMDRFETTRLEYRQCVTAGACALDPLLVHSHPPGPIDETPAMIDDAPVGAVTWNDAQAYCKFRGKRLPSEAEWEYAARGSDGRAFPWGNDFKSDRENHGTVSPADLVVPQPLPLRDVDDSDGQRYEAPVGSYPLGKSPFGVEDMAGNVAEWVADWYDDKGYRENDTVAPQGPSAGSYKVVRGGSYMSVPFRTRTTAREGVPPRERYPWIGIRCAQDLPKGSQRNIRSGTGSRRPVL